MAITPNELGMLEQLCYIDSALIEKATGERPDDKVLADTIRDSDKCTVSELLDRIGLTDEAIDKLASYKGEQIGGAWASGEEWASILKYLKSSELKDFVLRDTMPSNTGNTVLAMCFTKGGDMSEAIVAFKGTSEDEWVDNVEGLNVADTDAQKEALDYIESLPYANITVTGHSKGGNKAMYVAITSDKVKDCVAYDGQGFSQEFIDKYWAEIQERGEKITNYSLSTDYVHALMFPVPNSNQIYCKGYGVDNIGQHHSPNSFFVADENGNLILDENGKPMVVEIPEDDTIQMLHEFTTFILNNAQDTDKAAIVDYLAPLLSMVFRGGDEVTNEDKIDYILGDTDSLALIFAYLVKYMDEYDIGSDDVNKLLDALGLNSSLNELITLTDFDALGVHVDVNLNLYNILNYIKEQLNDGNDDHMIKYILLPILKAIFAKEYDIDITAFWEKINSKVKKINTGGGCKDSIAKTGTIRDFSTKVYDTLMSAIHRIENKGSGSVASWSNYSNEEWYSSLLVNVAIKGINSYFEKLSETNSICKTRINKAFDNVKEVDETISARMNTRCMDLQGAKVCIAEIANNIITT